MDIQFTGRGPMGGKILNYLAGEIRVVVQQNNERNFHAFYQVGRPEFGYLI